MPVTDISAKYSFYLLQLLTRYIVQFLPSMTISSPVADTKNQPRRETDWRLFMRLASYATRSKRLLIISIALLVPLAVSGAIQPILIGQAISVIRSETYLRILAGIVAICCIEYFGYFADANYNT